MILRSFPATIVLLAAALMTAAVPAALAGSRQFGTQERNGSHRVERHQNSFTLNRNRRGGHSNERQFGLTEPNTRTFDRRHDGFGKWSGWRGGENRWAWRGHDQWRGRHFARDTIPAWNDRQLGLRQPNTREFFDRRHDRFGNWSGWRGTDSWWAWRDRGAWRGEARFRPYQFDGGGVAPYYAGDGNVSVLPDIGTYVGGISAYPDPGNGIYFNVDGTGRYSDPPPAATGPLVLTVTANNADAACSYEAGVCVIRP